MIVVLIIGILFLISVASFTE
ncbi:putative membrane protein, partial [Escherichia coli PA24]